MKDCCHIARAMIYDQHCTLAWMKIWDAISCGCDTQIAISQRTGITKTYIGALRPEMAEKGYLVRGGNNGFGRWYQCQGRATMIPRELVYGDNATAISARVWAAMMEQFAPAAGGHITNKELSDLCRIQQPWRVTRWLMNNGWAYAYRPRWEYTHWVLPDVIEWQTESERIIDEGTTDTLQEFPTPTKSEIIDYYQHGMSVGSIAELCGATTTAVTRWLKQWGVNTKLPTR